MSSPTSPKRIVPFQKQLITGLESVAAGTAATVLTREGFRTCTTDITHTTEDQIEMSGTSAGHVGNDEMWGYATTNCELPARPWGLGGLAPLVLCGNGSEATTGAGPYVHTGTPSNVTTSMNTMTLWHDDGDRNSSGVAQNLEQILFATLASATYRFQPGGVAVVALQWMGKKPQFVANPTINNFVGSTANMPKDRAQPFNTTFTIYGSDSTAYTAKITAGNLALTRAVSPEPAMGSSDPYDFVPSELMLAGGFTAIFDGNASASIRRDFASFAELGDSSHVHNVTMGMPDATSSIAFNFYPLRITAAGIDASGRVKITCSFITYNDAAQLNKSSPALTTLKSVVVTDGLTGNKTS